MQQIFEQYSIPFAGSREPAHAMKTIFFGTVPSDGRRGSPSVGPDAERRRSNCSPVRISLYLPYPYSGKKDVSLILKPVATTTEPTSISINSSCWSKWIAFAGHLVWQNLHLPFLKYEQRERSMT